MGSFSPCCSNEKTEGISKEDTTRIYASIIRPRRENDGYKSPNFLDRSDGKEGDEDHSAGDEDEYASDEAAYSVDGDMPQKPGDMPKIEVDINKPKVHIDINMPIESKSVQSKSRREPQHP